jgi:hypothetical protein
VDETKQALTQSCSHVNSWTYLHYKPHCGSKIIHDTTTICLCFVTLCSNVTICSNRQMVCRCCPVATVDTRKMCAVATNPHISNSQSNINDPLLLAHTIAMVCLTSKACCYCGGTWHWRIATSPHSSDRSFDISNPLLLVPTIVRSLLTSEVSCYYGTRGTGVVATSPHSSDKSSDISNSLLLAPTVAMSHLTSAARCY